LNLFSYGLCIDPNQFTVVAEIFPAHLRTQAVSIAVTAIFLSDVLWLELEPTAQAHIGWKYYLVFACLGLAHTVYLYFYLPEVSTIQTSIQHISSNSNLTEF
jgi:predicted MFS family arabinose efflux permease